MEGRRAFCVDRCAKNGIERILMNLEAAWLDGAWFAGQQLAAQVKVDGDKLTWLGFDIALPAGETAQAVAEKLKQAIISIAEDRK